VPRLHAADGDADPERQTQSGERGRLYDELDLEVSLCPTTFSIYVSTDGGKAGGVWGTGTRVVARSRVHAPPVHSARRAG
jgi:hypothetical protein